MFDGTIVSVSGDQTVVQVHGDDLLREIAAEAQLSAADAASAAAAAEAFADIITGATANISVDASLVVRPESNGGTTAVPFQSALTAAGAAAGIVQLSANTTYVIDRELIVPVGVTIRGPRSAVVKLTNQATAALLTGFTAGTGAKTFKVSSTDAAKLVVGASYMWFNETTHLVSPNDAFSHAGRQISAKVNNGDGTWNITIAAGPNVSAHAAGDIMASTSHIFRLQGDNILDGFSVDGNGANNTYAHWYTSVMVVQEGNRCTLRDLYIHDTPTDAYMPGGPLNGEIVGSWTVNCDFENIGGNGIHYGNAADLVVSGCRMVSGNTRYFLPIERGGGANARQGHQDGAVIFSDKCHDLIVMGCHIIDWVCGVGALGTTATINNDNVTVIGCKIIDCARPLEVTNRTKNVIFSNNRCEASFPFGTGSNRWTGQQIVVDYNGDASDGPSKIKLSGNTFKNLCVYGPRFRSLTLSDNLWDNRDFNGVASPSVNFHAAVSLSNWKHLSMTGNVVLGGYVGAWLQNGIGTAYCLDAQVSDNQFVNQYLVGIGGTDAFPVVARMLNNRVRVDSTGTKEDGTTVLSFSGSYTAIKTLKGSEITRNRIDLSLTGSSAWAVSDATANANREGNVVNGQVELLASYANDAAAATGNVAVGGSYFNTTVNANVQRRA